jgi:hypothetical protein
MLIKHHLQVFNLSLQGSGIQSLLSVVADQYAAQAIGALSHLACQRFAFVRAGHQPRRLLHVVQFVEGFLSLPGVIAILLGHMGASSVLRVGLAALCCLQHPSCRLSIDRPAIWEHARCDMLASDPDATFSSADTLCQFP